MKIFILAASILFFSGLIYPEGTNDAQAYIVYKQACDQYKFKKYDEARNYYLELINEFPDSKFVPYSIYVLSFIETDYVKIIDYLSIIRDKYPEFQYWTNSVEKLADIFYVMDNQNAAIDEYKRISTDRSIYMLALIYSSNGLIDQAEEESFLLLKTTKDNALAYRCFLILIKCKLDRNNYADAMGLIQQALKLRKWAFDNGSRSLYYAGKTYFYKKDILNHYEKSLYIFSLLKTTFPLSPEASMTETYLDYLKKNNIEKTDEVRWIADSFTVPVDVPYQNQTLTVLDNLENKAEEISSESENINGRVIKSDFIEYVVRIGEFKDLSVASLAAADIAGSGQNIPLGVYYRNDQYIAEVRGIKNINQAKDLAKRMINLGYKDTKVLEVVKVIEYSK